MDEIRVAIVGCGRQGERHSRYFAGMGEGVRVVATADADVARAKKLADVHGCQWYTDYRDVLARDDVNAVVDVLPHALLARFVVEAAAVGKHVLCEKPLGVNAAEAEEAVRACEQAGVTLMVGAQHRYRAVVRGLREIVASGEIGRVYLLEEARKTRGFDPGYPSWYRSKEMTGGGQLQNSTSHSLDQIRFVMGMEIAGVSAMVGRYVHAIEGEDSAALLLRFEDGTFGTSAQSWNASGTRLEVTGTRGQAKIEIDNALYIHNGVSWREVLRTPEGEDERRDLDRQFVRCLREGLPPSPSGREYLGVVRAIEAAYRSVELRREVSTSDL